MKAFTLLAIMVRLLGLGACNRSSNEVEGTRDIQQEQGRNDRTPTNQDTSPSN